VLRVGKHGGGLARLLCGVALLVSLCIPARAQRYSFREYTEGLGNLNIACLAQDHTGYLWVGTQNGLYRYDGAQFQAFGAAEGLPERMISDLFVSPDGTLWVATTTGIFFERRDGHFTEVRPTSNSRQFLQRTGTVFAASRPDEVLTVTRTGAFRLQRTGEETWKAEPLHLDGSTVWSVLYAQDGVLWYGCDSDLCRLADGKSTHVGAEMGLPEEKWTNLLFTRDGHLWVRGNVHVGEIDLKELRYTAHDVPGQSAPVAYPALSLDATGHVLTSAGSTLGLWEDDHWRMVDEKNGLPRYEIQDLYVDREGSVWISEVGHGLKRWVGQDRWEGYTEADGLSDDLVWASMRDAQGRLWIGTESGLDYIPAGEPTPRVWKQPGFVTSRTGALAQTSDGSIWVGSAAGSLIRINGTTLVGTQWKLPEVYSVMADQADQVWVATNNGIYTVNAKGAGNAPVLVQDRAIANPRERFADIFMDKKNRLWAAADQGVLEHDASGWHRIDLGSPDAKPDLLAVDHDGYLWTGGPSQDVLRSTIENYKAVETKHIGRPPLLSQQAVAMMVDSLGRIWIGQDAGLSMFNGRSWRSFTQDDGLIWNDTDSFALTEDKDGTVWVGTSGGLSHLLAPNDDVNTAPQPPVFSQVTYGSAVIGNGGASGWSSNPVEISMALLSFKGTQDGGIRYRLVGAQTTEWEVTHDMEVRYRGLGPGDYRFEVAEADQAGHAISPVASFKFQITPRWWQVRSLQIGLGGMLVVGIMLLWRRRVGHLIRQKRHLEEAVKTRTIALEREKGELMRTREQMRYYAEHDDLTSLWNHRIIVDRLRMEVERSHREGLPLSIILVDMDYFKRINDTFGHPAGDRVLKEAAAIFQKMVRTYDWVGRYGGEEFLLILPGSGFAHARQRGEELRAAIESARIVDNETLIPLTASFGVASGFPESHEELIREADAALYRAKNDGRNRVMATEVDTRRHTIQRVG
jgi:diguanylate cyclase (GGDEF)-like protein